jgi:hypothetical protein
LTLSQRVDEGFLAYMESQSSRQERVATDAHTSFLVSFQPDMAAMLPHQRRRFRALVVAAVDEAFATEPPYYPPIHPSVIMDLSMVDNDEEDFEEISFVRH